MAKIRIKSTISIEEAFNNFLLAKNMEGLAEKTLVSYRNHLHCMAKHIDVNMPISQLDTLDFQKMICSMRESNLASNSIASYVRVLRAFLTWAKNEGLSNVYIPAYKTEETVKETYSDEELSLLLKKPSINKCSFVEYRTWVIINFLLNSGARASTIRHILIQDVDLHNGLISYRHNKNSKVQVIPLCSQMIIILREYLQFRKGVEDNYLFCTEEGTMMSEQCLRSSIRRYNASRGVSKNSIHMFRHTFAKKYLIDCGGDAFTLQRVLGHSTLEMTKHYCKIFDVDLVKNYDNFSPLQNISARNRITMNRR